LIPPHGFMLLRRDGMRAMLGLFLQVFWRLEATPQQKIDPVEIDADNERDVGRQQLRHQQDADYRDAQTRIPNKALLLVIRPPTQRVTSLWIVWLVFAPRRIFSSRPHGS
jgi:hypothetical protein